MKATTPPIMSDGQEEYKTSVFCRVPLADATLYVPAESVEAYKSANQWKDFGTILPISGTDLEDITTTQVYAHLVNEKLKNDYEYHPRNKIYEEDL